MREREKRMENLRVSAGRAIGYRRRAAARLLVAIAVCLLPRAASAAGAFRLGTAAAPFGWATATADFDVDHDNDLDIVVTPALTGEVLAVWLNDGFGRFTPAAHDHPRRLDARHRLM